MDRQAIPRMSWVLAAMGIANVIGAALVYVGGFGFYSSTAFKHSNAFQFPEI